MPRTVPVTTQPAAGTSYITAALWTAGPKALGDFTLNPPIAYVYQTTTQSIPNSAWTSVAMDASRVDTDNGHSNVTNNSRYTCQIAGIYRIKGHVVFNSNITGGRSGRIAKNGTVIQGSESYESQAVATFGQSAYAETVISLAFGDYVELQAFQSSGGALGTVTNSEVASSLNVQWEHA